MSSADEIRQELAHQALVLGVRRSEAVEVEERIRKLLRKVKRTDGISVEEAAEIVGVSKARAYQIVNGTR